MEKRKLVRLFTASNIELFDPGGNLICDANVGDISKSGILIVFYGSGKPKHFANGEKMRFHFHLPSGKISGIAEVAWSKQEESRVGLKFTALENENSVSNLMAFVANAFSGK